jgi:hypothetical protein
MVEAAGQICETTPTGPGVLSYFNSIRDPQATAAIHPTPNKAVTRIFLLRDCTEVETNSLILLEQTPFQLPEGFGALRIRSRRYRSFGRRILKDVDFAADFSLQSACFRRLLRFAKVAGI